MRRDSSLHTPSTSPVLGMASGVQTLLVCSVGRIIHKVVLAICRSLLSNYSCVFVQLPLLAHWIPPHPAVKPPPPPPDLQQHQKVSNSGVPSICGGRCVSLTPPNHNSFPRNRQEVFFKQVQCDGCYTKPRVHNSDVVL